VAASFDRATEHDRPAWRSHCYVFRGLDFAGVLDLLSALNVASTLQDLSPLKSVGLHKRLDGVRYRKLAQGNRDE
jgi:proteic killer suppression protein